MSEPVGVFGGSGFYRFLEDVQEIGLETPYGKPSGAYRSGRIEGREVIFLPRHGEHHEHPAHAVNYRANVWGMRELGVKRIIAPAASGSLRRELKPGDFVVVDQFVDLTRGRPGTFYDGPDTTHVAAGEPYCPDLRGLLVAEARELRIPVWDGGTAVVVQGPRFSTKAESRWFAAAGWDVINMTGCPEAALARELELCYASVCLVTDYDIGLADQPGVPAHSAGEILRVFRENLDRLRDLLLRVIPRVGTQPQDVCATALEGARVR